MHPAEILLAKALPPYLLLLVQQAVLFLVGVVALSLRPNGSMLAIALVAAALGLALMSFGLLLAVVCRSVHQIQAFTNVGGIILGGLGGALAPVEQFPTWVRAIAPATPGYWAMKAFRACILEGGGVREALPSIGVLLGMAVACGLVVAARFRPEEAKLSFV